MKIKNCGTCEFWDRENMVWNLAVLKASHCLAPVPDSVAKKNKVWMRQDEGKNCPVYKERQDVK